MMSSYLSSRKWLSTNSFLESKFTEKQRERFLSYVQISVGCWTWLGPLNNHQYGAFTLSKLIYGAHRISYYLEYGPIPEEWLVRHKCDNTLCVNPKHLLLGADVDNSNDKFSRGRHKVRISLASVEEIRSKYKLGDTTIYKLAKEYNCSTAHISRIINKNARTKM